MKKLSRETKIDIIELSRAYFGVFLVSALGFYGVYAL